MITLTKKNFIDLIQKSVPLEEHGAVSSGFCPFCYDEEESFLVYPEKQQWRCIACLQKGDIYNFIEQTENISTQEAEQFIRDFINQSADNKVLVTETAYDSGTELIAEPELTAEPEFTAEPESDLENNTDPETEIAKEQAVASTAEHSETQKTLLESFQECTGCQGIAIIQSNTKNLVGSSIDSFEEDDIRELNSFVTNTLELASDVLGNCDTEDSRLMFRMTFTTMALEQKKLIWLPVLSKDQNIYYILMLLDESVSEKMLILKLQKRFSTIDI